MVHQVSIFAVDPSHRNRVIQKTVKNNFLKICQDSGWEVTGVEPNRKAKQKAEKKLKRETCIHTDIHAFFKDNTK